MDQMARVAMGYANRGREMKVFDWDAAAKYIKENDATYASAGLDEDWSWTSGSIFQDGKPVNNGYTYLASIWATPTLHISKDGWYKSIALYKMESETDWNEDTVWPKSALEILGFTEEDVVKDDD